ncbi:phage tail tape measure protein, partial [Faecalibaculum rodentium]|uniref:phage tail tape measure protein n=1 Tax=Faecalibaculum rodentium TaxID=1702221 RepID=UPI0025A2558F
MAQHDGVLNFLTKIDSSGFKKGLDGIGGIAKAGIGMTTKVLQGATAGLTALGGAAIKVGSDFEAGMSQVQAISGASGEDLEKLKNKAKEMGATTKFSATESAEALNYMAMAGWKTKDMLGGLEGVMNLAAASGEDLATASDIVTDAMTALRMQASEAGHFSDVLAAAASNANTSVGGMGETFKYAGAMAGTLGYSVEDVALATGLMANAGIKGTMAGTSLNSIMTRLSTNTNGARDAIEELGVSFFKSDGSARSLTDVMSELREATADMTTEQKANFANTVAGMESQKGLSAILNATEDDYNKLSAAIQNADGCALKMAETMQDNLQGQITILQSGLEGLGISIYETFQGTAKDVVKEAQGMIQQLQDAFNEGGLDGIVSAVGNVLAQIIERIAGAAPELVNMAVGLVGSLCEGLKSAPGIGDTATSLITTLITGFLSCIDDLWSTAIVLIGKMAEGMAAGAPQVVQAISTTITDILECLVDWGPDLLQAGVDILMALVDGIVSALPTLIYQISMLLLEVCEALRTNLPAITQAAIDIAMALINGLAESAPLLLEAAVQLLMTIIEAIPVVIEQLLAVLPELITTICGFLTENIPLIVDAAIQLLMGIIEAIPTIIQAIVDNLPLIITSLVDGLTGALPQIVQAAITLLMGIIEAIPTIIQAIVDNL